MQFNDIIGQENVIEQLLQTVHSDRIPHAQLFLGPEGAGNLPLALAYAQYVNCENPTSKDSCGQCASCLKSEKFVHPDIHFSFPVIRKQSSNNPPTSDDWLEEWRAFISESPYQNNYQWLQFLEAENRQGNITAHECQSIIHKLNLKPYEGTYKILIMWMPEYLGKNGNILLKIIEEPPPNTLFLFVAENQEALLNTILSRLQLVKLYPLEDEAIQTALIEKNDLSEKKAAHIAHLAEGNFTEAQNLLEEHHQKNFEHLRTWLNICLLDEGIKRKKWINNIARLGREEQKHFLKYCLHILRATLLFKFQPDQKIRANPEEQKRIKKLAKLLEASHIETIVSLLDRGHYYIERNAHPKILFFHLTSQLALQLNKRLKKSLAK